MEQQPTRCRVENEGANAGSEGSQLLGLPLEIWAAIHAGMDLLTSYRFRCVCRLLRGCTTVKRQELLQMVEGEIVAYGYGDRLWNRYRVGEVNWLLWNILDRVDSLYLPDGMRVHTAYFSDDSEGIDHSENLYGAIDLYASDRHLQEHGEYGGPRCDCDPFGCLQFGLLCVEETPWTGYQSGMISGQIPQLFLEVYDRGPRCVKLVLRIVEGIAKVMGCKCIVKG